jgi:hypothetical protein
MRARRLYLVLGFGIVLASAHRPPAVRSAYVRFEEGDPGTPGDGAIVNASGPSDAHGFRKEFQLKPGLQLGEVTDGITFVVFPPPGTVANVAELGGGFDTIAPGKSGNCRSGFSLGFPLTTFPTVSVNGTTGAVITLTRATLDDTVATTERSRACGFALNEFVIDKVRIGVNRPARAITALDALAVGFSTNIPELE